VLGGDTDWWIGKIAVRSWDIEALVGASDFVICMIRHGFSDIMGFNASGYIICSL
jgi:hypothetical protein